MSGLTSGLCSRNQLSEHQRECEFDFGSVVIVRDNLPKRRCNGLDMALTTRRQLRDELSDSRDF